MRAIREAHRGACAADLLHRNDMLKVAQAAAAVLRLDRNPQEPKRAELRPQIARELIRRIDLRRARCDQFCGKIAHRLAQQIHALPQIEVEFDHLAALLSFGWRKLSLSSSSSRGARQAQSFSTTMRRLTLPCCCIWSRVTRSLVHQRSAACSDTWISSTPFAQVAT